VSLGIAALSLNLLLGYAGQLSLGHAALLGAGAFGASVVVDRWSAPMFLGWIAAAVVGGAVALIIGVPALRLRGIYLALVTMVFGLTMQASVLRWQVFTRGSAGAALPRRLIGDHILTNTSVYLAMTLVVLVLVWLVDRNVLRTKIGRAFRMIREDETVAQAFAIDVTRYKLLAFVLAGAIAGLAGALYGHSIGLVNSDVFSLQVSLRIVLFVMIGGIGTRWGAVAAAILLSLNTKLPESLRGYDLIIAALIVLYNVVRFPGGLAGLVAHWRGAATTATVADDDEEVAIPHFVVDHDETTIATDEPLLVVEEVTVQFGGLRAVDSVSLSVRAGTIVGIIGPNGAGKSTFFNAISGFAPTSSGRVFIDGRAVHELPPHARAAAGLARTFQNVGLAKDLSVRDNILLAQHRAATYNGGAALLYTRAANEIEQRLGDAADAIVGGLGFAARAATPVRELSGGQQRLVELGAVLATGPRLLMLDEPTAGLSPGAAENLADRLRELRDDHGQTILLIEHNVPLVLDLCDYVYVLNAGALLAEGPPRQLARKPEVLSAYLGEVVL
ncbi:MAG TPA: branched-chain amino acid ABC transporter ATP-binding protein/permease, partial [Acidimicrobiales bacterium]|nr:branched-chain amino acid ABC transporter ATP-binding protein/permease [Acidimicrobiales bacterium]